MAKGKKSSVPLKASVPAASKKKAQLPPSTQRGKAPAPQPASDTESSEDADSEASGSDDDNDDDDESDDGFEDQGSSSEEDADEDDEDADVEDAELAEVERKTRRFTVDRERQMQLMRDDGSLQVASQLHIDDLSSDDEETLNTIGNVPLRWYEDYDHIGYDVEGKKIIKSNASGDGIDMAIAAKDDPDYEYVLLLFLLLL